MVNNVYFVIYLLLNENILISFLYVKLIYLFIYFNKYKKVLNIFKYYINKFLIFIYIN